MKVENRICDIEVDDEVCDNADIYIIPMDLKDFSDQGGTIEKCPEISEKSCGMTQFM